MREFTDDMTIRTSSRGKRGHVRSARRFRLEMSLPVRFLVLAMGLAVFVALAGAGVYGISKWLCRAPFFTVTGVTINGCSRVNEETILNLSGVKPNSNLLALDLDAMAAAIERHPWIKSAAISKKLPDRLEIVVEERKPVAMVSMNGLYLIDDSGTVFKKISQGESFDLPLITGISSLEAMHGDVGNGGGGTAGKDDNALSVHDKLKRALRIIALASKGTRTLGVNDISEIHIKDDDLILYTADKGLPLRFSNDAPLRRQFQRAEKILYHLYSSGKYKKIAMVDLDYGSDTALCKVKN